MEHQNLLLMKFINQVSKDLRFMPPHLLELQMHLAKDMEKTREPFQFVFLPNQRM